VLFNEFYTSLTQAILVGEYRDNIKTFKLCSEILIKI
jgi:hypothetical protein